MKMVSRCGGSIYNFCMVYGTVLIPRIMVRRLCYIFLAIFCVSCYESKEKHIIKLVSEWEGRQIIFPEDVAYTLYGKDTISMYEHDSCYKILTYIDSTGCVGCRLNLDRWLLFAEQIDTLFEGNVSLRFFIHPKDDNLLKSYFQRDCFNLPVCFDYEDEINTLNHFPEEIMFQTFLLDTEDRVVAMGNPVLNNRVRELYIQILSDSLNVDCKEDLNLLPEEYDFGKFSFYDTRSHSFTVHNTTSDTLHITDVRTSCECVKANIGSYILSPYSKTMLRVVYTPDAVGEFYREVYVATDKGDILYMIKGITVAELPR